MITDKDAFCVFFSCSHGLVNGVCCKGAWQYYYAQENMWVWGVFLLFKLLLAFREYPKTNLCWWYEGCSTILWRQFFVIGTKLTITLVFNSLIGNVLSAHHASQSLNVFMCLSYALQRVPRLGNTTKCPVKFQGHGDSFLKSTVLVFPVKQW